MKIDILSIFTGMFTGPLTESLIKKACDKGLIDINLVDIRSFSKDKHKSVDDKTFGGGPGMVFKPEPVLKALQSTGAAKKACVREWPKKTAPIVLYMSPQGKPLTQSLVKKYAEYKHIVLLCGHYEGIDERLLKWVNQEVSIGDYVLTGGELPAMVLLDSVVRFLPGVVKEKASVDQDSFSNGLLDYPHYTRPAEFKGVSVPSVLLSGNHAEIERWRKEQSVINTFKKRPDLLKDAEPGFEYKEILKKIKKRNKKG